MSVNDLDVRTIQLLFIPYTERCNKMVLADTASQMAVVHPGYNIIAGHIEASRLHKNTPRRFSAVVEALSDNGTPLYSSFGIKLK